MDFNALRKMACARVSTSRALAQLEIRDSDENLVFISLWNVAFASSTAIMLTVASR